MTDDADGADPADRGFGSNVDAEVTITRQRIEPGTVDRLREWTDEILAREDEALATLDHEGMRAEAAFVERGPDGEAYLVYYMEADDVDAVYEAFADSDHEIDREHREVLREVLASPERVGTFEPLYHLRRADG